MIKAMDSGQFQAMVQAGAHRLSNNAEYVNSLNVFPVPDGDTGTNMNLTMTSGAKAVADAATTHVGELAGLLAKGLLMGARGNSGVILSQLFRGFSKAVEEKETLNAQTFAAAFQNGVDIAYKAVMKPVEGTILTVAREAAKAAVETAKSSDDCIAVMEAVVAQGKKALDSTPDLLPVLKEVGVVDSGGQGLLFVYEGFLAGLTGEHLDEPNHQPTTAEMDEMVNAEHHRSVQSHLATEDIQYGYCTEIMVRIGEGPTVKQEFDYETFRNHLGEIGDSLLVVADDEIIKVHVHTEQPGEVLRYGLEFGALIKVKVDNMRLQHETILENDKSTKEVKPHTPFSIITVVAGKGVQELFRSLGCDSVINGGQTMNPSTEDILTAIEEANADNVIILPNNKNIFMAAEQAAEASDIPAVVVPSKTIAQGMTAVLGFSDQASLEENKEAMTSMMADVKSGQITTAVRDTSIDGLEIHKGDYIGMLDNNIVVAEKTMFDGVMATLKKMIDDDSEIVTLIVGEGGTMEEAERIQDAILAMDDALEVEIYEGDQPVYPYLFSVE